MKILFSTINFNGKPKNYGVIDKFVSRSAQPLAEDFKWLRDNGVTDIINFRTMIIPELNFEEKSIVEGLGMNYHNIPTYTRYPQESNIMLFLKIIDFIKSNGGKAHIHCKAGADRTSKYAFIYKMLNNIGTLQENKAEWAKFGHHKDIYPTLMDWSENFVKRFLSKK